MTDNDQVVLNSILGKLKPQFKELDDSELFSLFCFEQVLKDYDLSDEELREGNTDGGGDGGIDGFFAFVNGVQLREELDYTAVGKNPHFDLFLIQVKGESSFTETALQKLNSTSRNILSLSATLADFQEKYNERLLERADQFREAYLGLSERHPTLRATLVYVTKGESQSVHPNVEAEGKTFQKTVDDFFSGAQAEVLFWGARELLDRSRIEPTYTLQLQFLPGFLTTGENDYVVLCKLTDYFRFVVDKKGNLRRYIFEANVRDYMRGVEVNKEIRQSLLKQGGLDFWWLNNGISLLASKASVAGKVITLDDVRIVNGLQTTNEVYHFLSGKDLDQLEEDRAILVRIIVLQDDSAQDRIIKATNFQTQVSPSSLRATDKIQKDIEDYFGAHGLYYDRRKNYYKNQGKPRDSIIGIQYLAQSVMAMVLQRPDDARARPTSLIKRDSDYTKIFSQAISPHCYLVCAQMVREVETNLKRFFKPGLWGFRNNFRFHIATVITIKLLGTTDYASNDICKIDLQKIDYNTIARAAGFVIDHAVEFNDQKSNKMLADQIAKNREFTEYLLMAASGDVTADL